MEQYDREVLAVLRDGTRLTANLRAEEKKTDAGELYEISVELSETTIVGESEKGFFDALRVVRRRLEEIGTVLSCLGASEDVYPSPMQEAMGPAVLAYRNRLGQQARSVDIVNIFDTDESVRPSTVEQQKLFHDKWLRSL